MDSISIVRGIRGIRGSGWIHCHSPTGSRFTGRKLGELQVPEGVGKQESLPLVALRNLAADVYRLLYERDEKTKRT